MSIVVKLLGLQELEIDIASLEKAMADARVRLGESPALRKAKEAVCVAEKNSEQLCSRQKELEWQSEELDEKIKVVNEKLYSGRITNPKELSNLQQESGLLSGKAEKIDEEALAIIEQAETAGQVLSQALEKLKNEENRWMAEQQQIKQEMINMEQKLAILRQRRSEVIGEIPSQALQEYERVKAKKGTALARVIQGACEGCRIGLSTAQLQRARGETLEKCANCGRILFCE
ncbi:MAG: hypothetical protein PHT28_05030 [Dehalococcoidales bacterium]|jgi:predicted  nucleic acid-binding Zn-ribbon protein|nr:hypothetical protein [Dehalococcoidales bacterium]MDD4230081.1 hypothetical protein [Dehalococcoidales bacterium]MDD4465301.1 hypothetical protein [Dehalococcoidales bacterium]MDD5402163.1 hypothetical protein [Dehalococcoidales bacterium]